MKMYTTTEQTAKLIELGFKKPKSMNGEHNGWQFMPTPAYSIGELIEMLPKQFDGELLEIATVTLSYAKWVVRYPYGFIAYNNELIDALYDMILQLKEEGVI